MQNAFLLVGGLAIVILTLYDVFLGVVVPRWTTGRLRITPVLSRLLWSRWKAMARRIGEKRRPDFLAAFAPTMLALLLALWVFLLVLGFAMSLFAMRSQIRGEYAFVDAMYLAGVAFLTIGFGDVVATGVATRLLTLLAGATGLVLTALVISLTFTLYSPFSRRESMILTLDARAGTPSSGLVLLETYAHFELLEDLPGLFDKWETWGSQLLESHLAYPLLAFFRSPHEGTSWAGSLGAMMDAATLLISTVKRGSHCGQRPIGAAHMMYHMGCHILRDLSVNILRQRFEPARDDHGDPNPGITHHEFMEARHRLEQAGFELREEEDAWRLFSQHRAVYAEAIDKLAQFYAAPTAQWIGERSSVSAASHHEAHPAAARAEQD